MTITVTIVTNQVILAVKDSTIYEGTPWTASDKFITATDKEGIIVDLSQLTITGTDDNHTFGEYDYRLYVQILDQT